MSLQIQISPSEALISTCLIGFNYTLAQADYRNEQLNFKRNNDMSTSKDFPKSLPSVSTDRIIAPEGREGSINGFLKKDNSVNVNLWPSRGDAATQPVLPRTYNLNVTPLDSVVIVPFETASGVRVLVTNSMGK